MKPYPAAEPAGETWQLTIAGKATIVHADRLREAFLEALATAQTLIVDVSQVTELDVTALQLFCTAHRSAISRQKTLVLADARSEIFAAQVVLSGFIRDSAVTCIPVAGQSCLWAVGEPAEKKVAS